jgi:hypothetical protein
MKAMLDNWNAALPGLHSAIKHPDTNRTLKLYAATLNPGDLAVIPERDLPAGLPLWMRSLDAWATRTGTSPAQKRSTITVTIPTNSQPT